MNTKNTARSWPQNSWTHSHDIDGEDELTPRSLGFFAEDEAKFLSCQISKVVAIGTNRSLDDNFRETMGVHGGDAHDAAHSNKLYDNFIRMGWLISGHEVVTTL